MSNGNQSKQLFLLDQQIMRLRDSIPFDQRRYHVCGDERPTEEIVDDPWESMRRFTDQKVPNEIGIVELARSEEWRRVALVCDAGLGKTTNLRWLHRHLCEPVSRVLSLLIPLDEPTGRILLQKERESGGILVRRLARQIMDAAKGKLKMHLRAVERMQNAGRIVLLIDGLDHAIANPETATMLKELIDSAEWRGCPVWIAGRPYAFSAAWPMLFDTDEWKFLRVGGLQRPEIRFYLARQAGTDVYAHFPDESAHLFAIPRLLNLMSGIIKRELPAGANEAAQLATLQRLSLATAADVYRLAYFHPGKYDDINSRGLLGQGLAGKGKRIGLKKGQTPDALNYETRLRRTAQILGAIAFEMYTMHADPKRPQPNFEGVSGPQLGDFETAVAERLSKAGLGKQSDFNRDFEHLTKMNVNTVEYLVFRKSDKQGLAWHDRTVQAFFAAYWAMNYATRREQKAMDRWKVVTIHEKSVSLGELRLERLKGFDEFWEFAAELPDELLSAPSVWLDTFRPCYKPPQELRGEHEWVQWHRRMLCRTFFRVEKCSPCTIAQWRNSFHALALTRGNKKRIYRQLTDQQMYKHIFCGICAFGAEPEILKPGRPIPVSAFLMHQWQVTNEMYEAFDSSHAKERWNHYDAWVIVVHPLAREAKNGDNCCPVVNVTWFDAWCFAHWCGCRLPTEAEWEHACRADGATQFCYGNDLDSSMANFDGTFPGWNGIVGPDVGYTTVVGSYSPNAWGLYDMHGNVDEWCESLYDSRDYDSSTPHMVMRGGNWDSEGRYCAAAWRHGWPTTSRHTTLGFRLVRDLEAIPDVGTKSHKQSGGDIS